LAKKQNLLLVLIAGVAIAVSVFSYNYFSVTSEQISSVAIRETSVKNNLAAEMLSEIISNRFESIHDKLAVLAHSPDAINGDYEAVKSSLMRRQQVTSEVTESYFWLDKEGRVVWGTLMLEKPEIAGLVGADFSDREYFIHGKEKLEPYSTAVNDSVDGLARIHLSYPIVSPDGDFLGIVAATIRPQGLASFVESQIPSDFDGTAGMIDKQGTIVYSEDKSLIGKNVFDGNTQSLFASAFELDKDAVDYGEILEKSLGGQHGSMTLPMSGLENSYAYSPVYIGDRLFGSLHVTTPQTLDTNVALLVQQQKNVSMLMILIVGAAAIGIAAAVLMWNKRLDAVVVERTKQLEASNKELSRTMDDLRMALSELAENNRKLLAANEQLQRHDKMQQEFINVAAHELRTPVQPLLGIADILSSQFKGDKDSINVSKPEIEMIIRNAKRLERLSSDILQVSRIESQSLKLNKETFDLNDKIRDVVADARSFMPDHKKVQIIFEPAAEPLLVNADKIKIFEVVSNILRNAIKFTDEGTITVLFERRTDGYAVVSIKDTGVGIDPAIYPRLFTKFTTGQDKQYDSRSGSGLGLFIARNIIEAHGGRIWAENNKDEGATFSFTLPLQRMSANAS
jgi:signal transduction histidine kinase